MYVGCLIGLPDGPIITVDYVISRHTRSWHSRFWPFAPVRVPALRVSLLLIFLVALMEVVQLWIPTRHSDVWDIIYGGSGILSVLLGFELYYLWNSRRRAGHK